MTKETYRFTLAVLCLVVLLAGRTVVGADGVNNADRLRTLETQQNAESRKLSKAAGDIAWLLEELESNGLLEQGGGEKVKALKVAVSDVAHERLPLAARHLRNARLERDASRHYITSAHEEVEAIVEQLKAVLAGSSALLANEALVLELKDMIKVQTQVRGQTAEWGKALLINPETANAGKGPLMQDQAKILARYQTFLGRLQQVAKDAFDEAAKSRFQQAEQLLNPPPPTKEIISKITTPEPTTGEVLQAAAEQIERLEVLAAVGAQDRAIASFKAALQILSAGQFELAEFVAGLEKLIAKQKALRKDTDAEEQLGDKHAFYEARQIEIQDEATDYSYEAPDLFVSKKGEYLVEPLMTALEEAVAALNAAQPDKAMAALIAARKRDAVVALKTAKKNRALVAQDKVIALLESVYGTAAKALKEKEEGDDPFWAESPVVPEDLWMLPPDGEKEDTAQKDEDMPEIFEGITSTALMVQPEGTTIGSAPDVSTAGAANKFLGLEEMEEDSEPGDFITDEGPPSAGGEAPEAPGENTEGDTTEVEKDRLARESMQRQPQKAKIQDYVRQLPPEFRRQVADYYEVIAQ